MKNLSGFRYRVDLESALPVYKQLMVRILEQVISGELAVGTALPSLHELSCLLVLSRSSVEKAYVKLREQGVVGSHPGKSYYIRDVDVGELYALHKAMEAEKFMDSLKVME